MNVHCRPLIGLYALWIAVSACSPPQHAAHLRVFAAASLTDALTEIGAAFDAEHRIAVSYNFAASTTLQRQLEKGASADIFISAGARQVDALHAQGILQHEDRADILTNRLVIVAHETAPIHVETPDRLTAPAVSKIAIGHPDIVPAGTYAKEALTHFRLWERLHPKFVFGADVRATLAYLTAGNVDIAIVYETDTTLTENIKVLYRFPLDTYTRIVYPAVVLRESSRKQTARRFIAYLRSPESTEIFEKHRFTVLAAQ